MSVRCLDARLRLLGIGISETHAYLGDYAVYPEFSLDKRHRRPDELAKT